jgi:hypothetical protein
MSSGLLKSSEDLFLKLIEDHKAFQNDPLSTYKVVDCAMSAWHLTDWVYKERESVNYPDLGSMRTAFSLQCNDLNVMHDLITGGKHLTVSRPKSDVSGTHLHEGVFSMEFSLEFDVSILYVDFKDGSSEPIIKILERVVSFWSSYFGRALDT